MNDQNTGRKLGGRSGIFGNNQAPPIFTADTADSQTQGLVLDLISEGPILGVADIVYGGNGAKSIFLNNTPLQRADGGYNFGQTIDSFGAVHPSKMAWAFRTGTATQDWMRGFSSVESESAGGGKVVKANTGPAGGTIQPTQHVNDAQMDAVIVTMRIPALSVTDSKGNVLQFTVGWNIQYQDLSYSGGFVNFSGANGSGNGNYHVSGKSSSGIDTQCYQLLKPPGYVQGPNGGGVHPGWNIRVTRLTQDLDNDVHYQASTVWYSTTTVLEQKLSYPFSAMVGIEAPSAAFGGQMPTRNYDVFGRVVMVPSNYTPTQYAEDGTITPASYIGMWNGTYQLAWTDNPVWCVLDMLTNARYGLNVPFAQIDVASLYVISQYCDAMISDGQGSLHPRYTLNIQITTQQEAYNIINQLCATMMTMVYYTAGLITFAQDSPRQPDMIVTPANAIDGQFNYAGQTYENTPNVIVTRYLNPQINYQPDTAVVQNTADIAKRGQAVPLSLDAFGIDDPGRATRVARWALYTNIYEGEVLTYQAGLDHADMMPGMIVAVQDPVKVGTPNIGGRVLSSFSATNLMLWSQHFISGWGVQAGAAFLDNQAIAPDGTMTAALLTVTGTAVSAMLENLGSVGAGTYNFSFFVRTVTGTASISMCIFNATDSQINSPVFPITTVWTRINWTVTITQPSNWYLGNLAGSGAGNFYVWGGQVTNTTGMVDYILTTTAAVTKSEVVLDRFVQLIANHTYTLNMLMPNKTVSEFPVVTVAGSVNTLNLNAVLSDDVANAIWTLQDNALTALWWRVLSKRAVTRSTFEITATHRYPGKFDLIESNLAIEGQAYNTSTNTLPAPLQSSLKVQEYLTLNQSGVVSPRLLIGWGVGGSSTSTLADALPTDARITNYTVQMRLSHLQTNVFDDGTNQNNWTTIGQTRSPSLDIIDLAPNTYDFQVRAETDFGLFSDWTIITGQIIASINLAPADVTGMSINVLGDNATLSWDAVTSFNLSFYEVRYSPDTSGTAIWDTASVLQTGIRTISIQTPNLPGTYFVKAVNIGGVYSINASLTSGGAIISAVTGLTIINTLHSVKEELNTTLSGVAISIASPAIITWANHGLPIGTPVAFTTTGALPTGIVSGTTYFVIAAGYLPGSFEISATLGGSAVNTSGTQSGVHTGAAVPWHGLVGSLVSNGLSVVGGNLFFTPPSSTVTITLASPAVITWTAHKLAVGTPVAFSSGADVLPADFVAGTIYYIANVLGVNTFTLAATPDGPEISTAADTQSGTHTLTAYGAIYTGNFTQPGSSIIDLGALLQCRVSPTLLASAQLTGNVMASWTSLAALANMTGVSSNQWSAQYQMRFSDQDPAVAPFWHGVAGWSAWMPAVTGDFKFWAMQTQLVLSVVNTATLTITATGMDLDIVVPDRVIAANNLAIPAAATAITFLGTTGIRPFFHLDGITITVQNPATGDTYNLTAMSETGFTIELFNSAGTPKTGTINFVAKGYGSA